MSPSPRSWVPWSYFLVIVLVAFSLNWLWEMAQMPAYQEMAGKSWLDSLGVCTFATLGDVVITAIIYGVGALAAGDIRWGLTGKWNVYATATLLGAAVATVVEWKALAAGRWSYSDLMPMVPVLGVGLLPFLQPSILVPITFAMSARWHERHEASGR